MECVDNCKTAMKIFIFMLGLLSSLMAQDIQAGTNLSEDYRKRICEENGKPEAFQTFKDTERAHQSCFSSLCSMAMLRNELGAALPSENLTNVFGSYCQEMPSINEMMNNSTAKMAPCLTKPELANMRILQKILDYQLSFVCNENDSYGMDFMAAGGLRCIQFKYQTIQACIPTIDSHVPGSDFKTRISLVLRGNWFDEQHCKSVHKLRTCWVTELRGCKNSSLSIIADSFLKHVLEITPCGSLASRIEESAIDVLFITVFMIVYLWLL